MGQNRQLAHFDATSVQKNKRLVNKLKSKESLLELLQDQLSEELQCLMCNAPFGPGKVPYTYVQSI